MWCMSVDQERRSEYMDVSQREIQIVSRPKSLHIQLQRWQWWQAGAIGRGGTIVSGSLVGTLSRRKAADRWPNGRGVVQ
jgi:hypothetical protein